MDLYLQKRFLRGTEQSYLRRSMTYKVRRVPLLELICLRLPGIHLAVRKNLITSVLPIVCPNPRRGQRNTRTESQLKEKNRITYTLLYCSPAEPDIHQQGTSHGKHPGSYSEVKKEMSANCGRSIAEKTESKQSRP